MTDTTTPIDRLAQIAKRQLLWLLVGAYLLAAVLPQAGNTLRDWQPFGEIWGEVPLSLPLVMLALLLFCAALSTDSKNIWAIVRQPWIVLAGLVGVWLGPVLFVSVVGLLLRDQLPEGILVGLALVATMPVANSSVGWTHSAQGDLAVSLGLILFSIALSPLVTPNLLQFVGLSMSMTERMYCDLLVNRFSGKFFIVWVILPSALGFLAQYLLGRPRVERLAGIVTLTSIGSLLLLNYANAALALPQLADQPQVAPLVATVALSVALSLLGMFLAAVLARMFRQPRSVRTPLLFGLSMKHTGLALVLAGTMLADQPLAILMIVTATVVQHLMAGFAQWMIEVRDG